MFWLFTKWEKKKREEEQEKKKKTDRETEGEDRKELIEEMYLTTLISVAAYSVFC